MCIRDRVEIAVFARIVADARHVIPIAPVAAHVVVDEHALEPVSYTHLDVYKRQPQKYDTVVFALLTYPPFATQLERIIGHGVLAHGGYDHPVSYTHLDVYKRQGIQPAGKTPVGTTGRNEPILCVC